MVDFPRNELEHALQKAAVDPSARSSFIDILLPANVFVIGQSPIGPMNGDHVFDQGEDVMIANWEYENGQPFIPFFTSLEALQESITEEVSYISLSAKELFELTLGSFLILNPGQAYGKEFTPIEVGQLLGADPRSPFETRAVETETPVQLGEPEQRPVELIDGLSRLFSQHGAIEKAYIALMNDPSQRAPLSLLVGIQLGGEIDLRAIGIGDVISAHAPNKLPVDVLMIAPDQDGPARYFYEHSQPFYERRKSLFGWLQR